MAQEAGVAALVLVHIGGGRGQAVLDQAREIFPDTHLARKEQRVQILEPDQLAGL